MSATLEKMKRERERKRTKVSLCYAYKVTAHSDKDYLGSLNRTQ